MMQFKTCYKMDRRKRIDAVLRGCILLVSILQSFLYSDIPHQLKQNAFAGIVVTGCSGDVDSIHLCAHVKVYKAARTLFGSRCVGVKQALCAHLLPVPSRAGGQGEVGNSWSFGYTHLSLGGTEDPV